MGKTTNIFVRVEPEIKNEAESILDDLGMTMSGAVNLFLRQIVLHKGLPFDVKLPKKKMSGISVPEIVISPQPAFTTAKTGRSGKELTVRDELKKKYGEIARHMKNTEEL